MLQQKPLSPPQKRQVSLFKTHGCSIRTWTVEESSTTVKNPVWCQHPMDTQSGCRLLDSRTVPRGTRLSCETESERNIKNGQWRQAPAGLTVPMRQPVVYCTCKTVDSQSSLGLSYFVMNQKVCPKKTHQRRTEFSRFPSRYSKA